MMMSQSKNKAQAQAKSNEENVKVVDEEELVIERIVAVTEAEILGMSMRLDKSDILLKFGYKKSDNGNIVIIDTRKRLPVRMAKELYTKLKEYLDNENEVEE